MDWPSMFDRLFSETPHVWTGGWAADYPDPDNFLRLSLQSEATGWRNETYDGLLEKAAEIMNQAERMRMYQRADRILIEEAPILPLYYGRLHRLMKPWVKKYPTSPMKDWFWKDVIIEPH
jgi:ABC-type oligopeptide transport system substrate-binding subunit